MGFSGGKDKSRYKDCKINLVAKGAAQSLCLKFF